VRRIGGWVQRYFVRGDRTPQGFKGAEDVASPEVPFNKYYVHIFLVGHVEGE